MTIRLDKHAEAINAIQLDGGTPERSSRSIGQACVLGARDESSPQSHAFTGKRGRPRNPDIERRIIRAAQACFARRGFDGTAMNVLASRAGTSKATIYLYFRTKQDLFKAALDNLLAQLPRASELTSRVTGDSVEERLLVVARRVGQLLSSARLEFVRSALASDISPPLRECVLETAGKPYLQSIDDYLLDEAARGFLSLGDSRLATSYFIALIVGPEALRSRWSGSAFGPIDEAQLRDAVRVFIRGHAAQPGHGTGR